MDLLGPLRAPEYVGRRQVTRETGSEEQDQKRDDHNTAGRIMAKIPWRPEHGHVAQIGEDLPRRPDEIAKPRVTREVLAYLRDVALRRAPRYLGHNPAGGAMIVGLLVMLLGTGITGYMMTTDAFWGAKWVEEVHETFANLTVGLVVFHVLGVLFSSFAHGENLVKSMITGRKRRS